MAGWASGYVVDVDYTHGFYKELTPSRLGFLSLLHGIEAPGLGIEPLAYCELGCGQGLSTNLLAAANPHIQFHATDFNPSHIAGARTLARAAGLSNVHFSDASFEEFLSYKDLPDFDFVNLHGIYSWISPENRRFIVQFIRQKLKPGGVVYISYNTMPGWASVMPMRRLMVEHTRSHSSKPILGRAADAVAFVERLAKSGSGYFANNHKVAHRLESLTKQNRRYIAHEYLNDESCPFFFTDLAKELSEAKLTWAGSARVLDTVEEIQFSPEQRQILDEIGDPAFREMVKDHFVDQQFRQDVFVKGPIKLSERASNRIWLDTRFALTSEKREAPKALQSRNLKIEFNHEAHEALLAALEGRARSLGDIMNDPVLSKRGLAKVKRLLTFLIGQNVCQPCLPAHGEGERIAHAERLNLVIAEHARSENTFRYLASGVTGSAFDAGRIHQLIWLGLHRKAQDVPGFVWECLKEAGQRLMKDGKPLQTDAENIASLTDQLSEFSEGKAPIWKSLGLLPDRVNRKGLLKSA